MKKVSVLLILIISFFLNQQAFSQKSNGGKGETTPMQVGNLFLNMGIGPGAGYHNPTYGTPFGFKISGEYGVWQAGPGVVTLGGEFGGTFSGKNNNGNNYNSSTFIIAARSAWHYGWDVPGLDTYGGFSAGFGFNHYSYPESDNHSLIPAFGIFAGASYFITPTFGFNSEFGYDITSFQIGVVFKLE
jgi:hypothetical protein